MYTNSTYKLYNQYNPNSEKERLTFWKEELKSVNKTISLFENTVNSPQQKQEFNELDRDKDIILKEIERIEKEEKIKKFNESFNKVKIMSN